MLIFKAIVRFVIGAIFGFAAAIALIPAAAAFVDMPGGNAWLLFLVILIGAVLGVFATTIRRAFGRGFLFLGASVFALPLSMMLLSGRVTSDMISQSDEGSQAMAAVGGTIAGTLMTGVAAFIGFFLGAIFLVIGLVLVLGGRRDVHVTNIPSYGQPAPSVPMASERVEPRF